MGSDPVRLYVNGVVLGYRRGRRTQTVHTSLIKIKGVDSNTDTSFYLGKRIAYITKSTSGYRVNWGKVCRPHGGNGVVRCKFTRNLPPQAIGKKVRVMLYPSRV